MTRSPARRPTQGRWFSVQEHEAVQDFWRVYDAAFGDSERWAVPPLLGPLALGLSSTPGPEHAVGPDAAVVADKNTLSPGQLHDLLRVAVRSSDWRRYERGLRQRGREHARAGRGLDLLRVEENETLRQLGPELVRALEDSPDRQIAALDVMCRFLGCSMAVLSSGHRAWGHRASGHSTSGHGTSGHGTSGHGASGVRQPAPASLGNGAITTDPLGRITRINAVARRLLGWTAAETLGRPIDAVFSVVDEDTWEMFPCPTAQLMAVGAIVSLPPHASLLARDGSRCPIAGTVAPIAGPIAAPSASPGGAPRGLVVVFRDQTRERAFEARVARSSSILEASVDAVLTVGLDGEIQEFNLAAEQMFGRARNETIGRSFAALLLPPGEGSVEIESLTRGAPAAAGQRPSRRREIRAIRADGEVFPAEITVVRVPGRGPPSFTCVVVDTTRDRRARDGLEDSQRQLRALAARIEGAREQERTRIAREIHDEFGQQLTAIRMDIVWLARRCADGGEVSERLVAMSRLVEDTLRVVRRLATELRPGILDDLGLAEAIEWQAREFEGRSGIRVDVHLPSELEPIDPLRATAIFRIFQETLTNVARHAGARHVVTRLTQADGQVTLQVADDGQGIGAEVEVAPHSLGLMGMRERAMLLGGRFFIERAPGGGTVATVTLPLGDTPQPAA